MESDGAQTLLVVLRRDSEDKEIVVRECPRCGALVPETSINCHQEFHAQRRSA